MAEKKGSSLPSKKFETVWEAAPHTIAKITILKSYLNAWFRIMGLTKHNQEILYIDGFSGPGKYTNYAEGSPVAALNAAQSAIVELSRCPLKFSERLPWLSHAAFFV